jgi:hypothetical protein
VNRSHLDSINFSFEKNKIYANQINILDSLKKKCEYINMINNKVIRQMDSIDYLRVQEITKLNTLNSNLRKKHKLELNTQKIKSVKRTVIISTICIIAGFIFGLSI